MSADCHQETCVGGLCVPTHLVAHDAGSIDGEVWPRDAAFAPDVVRPDAAAPDAAVSDAQLADLWSPDADLPCDGVGAWLGPFGGRITLPIAPGVAVLDVPPGALAASRFVCLAIQSEATDADRPWSPMVGLAPTELEFGSPATLMYRLRIPPVSRRTLARVDLRVRERLRRSCHRWW